MGKAAKRAKTGVDPALARAALVSGGEADEADEDANILPSGLPRVPLKLPKSALPAPPPAARLPTVDEQLRLRAGDSDELVRTNLLQMQLDALLDEVCVDYTAAATKPLDDYLCALRAALLALPVGEPLVDGDELPLRAEVGVVDALEWRPPTRALLTGSYLLRTQLAPSRNVDLLVEVPRACLREKDYLDHRSATRGRAQELHAEARERAREEARGRWRGWVRTTVSAGERVRAGMEVCSQGHTQTERPNCRSRWRRCAPIGRQRPARHRTALPCAARVRAHPASSRLLAPRCAISLRSHTRAAARCAAAMP